MDKILADIVAKYKTWRADPTSPDHLCTAYTDVRDCIRDYPMLEVLA
jgi:hypothetical protein